MSATTTIVGNGGVCNTAANVTKEKRSAALVRGSLFIWIGRAFPTLTKAIALGEERASRYTKYLSEAQVT